MIVTLAILKEERGRIQMEDSYKVIISRRKKANRDWLMNLLTFLFPFLAVVVAFAIQKVKPFGDRVMLTVDSYHQYAPFLIEFRNKALEGRSLFYTWNNGLGMEYYAVYANYCSSPLNIFSLFFTAKTMPIFIAFITAVRAGLASLFMSWFLTGEDEGRRDYITTAFACSYALCGWLCTDFWNIMWCDALVLFPLICIGLRKLFVEGKYALYVISLAVAIFSNYYTGYFICLFLILFAPVYYVMIFQTKNEEVVEGRFGFKRLVVCIVRFAVGSAVAGGLTAVLTLPVYKILQTTSAIGTEFPKEYELTGNLFDFLARFFVAANPNIRDGMANVYSGIIPILMVFLFFAASKETGIKLRHKIAVGILLVVMYLSFTNRTLNFIWHGFHFPNQIPYRQSFLFSFLIVFLGYKAIRVLKSFKASQVTAVFIGAGVYVVLFEKFGEGTETFIQILLSLLFIIIEGVFLRCTVMDKKKRWFFYESAISAVMALELIASSFLCIGLVAKHEAFPLYSTYGKNYDKVKEYATEVEHQDGHKVFERTEVYPNNFCNIQSIYDVRGLSTFSSTVRQSFVTYMRNFGFHNNRLNSTRSMGLTRVTATLLGIRNFIAADKTDSVPPIFDLESDDGCIRCYGNPDALSVGYMVSEDLLDYVPDEADKNPFAKTNLWVNSMGVPYNVYRAIDCYGEDMENATLSMDRYGEDSYSIINSNTQTSITFVVDDATIGSDVYIYLDSDKPGNYVISHYDADGNEIKHTASIAYRYHQIIPLGIYDGTTIKCKVTLPNSPAGLMRVYSYELDNKSYEHMVEILSSEQLKVTSYTDKSIEGEITTEDGGLLFMTLPYSEGFTAYVDDKPAEIISVGDALMSLKLEPGTHKIGLYYTPRLLEEGIIITVASLVILAFLTLGRQFLKYVREERIEAERKALEAQAAGEPSDDQNGNIEEYSQEVEEQVNDASQT